MASYSSSRLSKNCRIAWSSFVTWHVYAKANGWSTPKRPFAGPQQVLDYVGRYTHRVAISNNRLLAIEDGQVQFRYKDYRDRYEALTGFSLWECPVCHRGRMIVIGVIDPRGPPAITETS